MNDIVSFKGRNIDENKSVYVYRNLNKKGVWYSIKQGSHVKAHAKEINLFNCEFLVNENGREKVRRTGDKFPHAFIKGYVISVVPETPLRLFYNPKKVDGFIRTDNNEIVDKSFWVKCNNNGVFTREQEVGFHVQTK